MDALAAVLFFYIIQFHFFMSKIQRKFSDQVKIFRIIKLCQNSTFGRVHAITYSWFSWSARFECVFMAKGLLLEKLTIFTRWDFTEELEFDCFMKINKFLGKHSWKMHFQTKISCNIPKYQMYAVWSMG